MNHLVCYCCICNINLRDTCTKVRVCKNPDFNKLFDVSILSIITDEICNNLQTLVLCSSLHGFDVQLFFRNLLSLILRLFILQYRFIALFWSITSSNCKKLKKFNIKSVKSLKILVRYISISV